MLSAPLIVLVTFLVLTVVIGVSFYAYRNSVQTHRNIPRSPHETLWSRIAIKLSMLERGRSVDTIKRKMKHLEENIHTLPGRKHSHDNVSNETLVRNPKDMSAFRRFFYHVSMMERNPWLHNGNVNHHQIEPTPKQTARQVPPIQIKSMDPSTASPSSPVSFLPNPNTHPTSYYNALRAKEGTTGTRSIPSMSIAVDKPMPSSPRPSSSQPLRYPMRMSETSLISDYKDGVQPNSPSDAINAADYRMVGLDEETKKKYQNAGVRAPPPSLILPTRKNASSKANTRRDVEMDTADGPLPAITPRSLARTSPKPFGRYHSAISRQFSPVTPNSPNSRDSLLLKQEVHVNIVKHPSISHRAASIAHKVRQSMDQQQGLSVITDKMPVPPARKSSKIPTPELLSPETIPYTRRQAPLID